MKINIFVLFAMASCCYYDTTLMVNALDSRICDFHKPDYRSINELTYCNNHNMSKVVLNMWKLSSVESKIEGLAYSRHHFHCYAQETFFGSNNIYKKSLKIERLTESDNTLDKYCTYTNDELFESDMLDEDNDLVKLIKDKKLKQIPKFAYSKLGYASVFRDEVLDYVNPICHTQWARTSDTNGHLCKEEKINIVVDHNKNMRCDLTYCGNCNYTSGSCLTNFYYLKWVVKEDKWTYVRPMECLIEGKSLICNGELFTVEEKSRVLNKIYRIGYQPTEDYLYFERRRSKRDLNSDIMLAELTRILKTHLLLINMLYNNTDKNCITIKEIIGGFLDCDKLINKRRFDVFTICKNDVLTHYPCNKIRIVKYLETTCVDTSCKRCFKKLPVITSISDKTMYLDTSNNLVTKFSESFIPNENIYQEFIYDRTILVYHSCKLSYRRKEVPIVISYDYIHPLFDMVDMIYNMSELEKIDIDSMRQERLEIEQYNTNVFIAEIGKKVAAENQIPDILNPNQLIISFKTKFLTVLHSFLSTVSYIGGILFSFYCVTILISYIKLPRNIVRVKSYNNNIDLDL